MKKFFVIILFALLLTGCQNEDHNDITKATDTTTKDNYLDANDDLIFHDYDTGIKLSNDSKLSISQLNLDLKNDSAIIYAVNLDSREVIKLYDYQPNQDISFIPASNSTYVLAAKTSTGEIIDLTTLATVETTSSEKAVNEAIPLK